MGRTNETLWKKITSRVRAGTAGGRRGQWSARKAQIATKKYKEAGGGYTGTKTKAQKSLSKWTKQDWGTKSGKNSTQGPNATGERYLPKKARDKLTKKEYASTTAKKRKDTKAGRQYSSQPSRVAKKTKRYV
tara:strand:+ start:86 stop:481 length:396 start_codon:yes stop_codon:yes gene_type:complete